MNSEDVTIAQAAMLLGTTEDDVRQMVENGSIPFSHDGDIIKISPSDIQRILQNEAR